MASNPVGGSCESVRSAMRHSKCACSEFWKKMWCLRGVALKCMPPWNRALRTKTPLSPGALPAPSIVGGPPSFCARRTSETSANMVNSGHDCGASPGTWDREMGTVRRRRKVPRLPLAAPVAANTASARRYVPRDASWTARLPQPICHHFQRLGCQTSTGPGQSMRSILSCGRSSRACASSSRQIGELHSRLAPARRRNFRSGEGLRTPAVQNAIVERPVCDLSRQPG